MARIRTLKPEFWTHEELSALPESTHMLAAALLNYADDEGYFNANPMLIKAACSPLREPSVKIPESLQSLQTMGYLEIGTAPDGKRYGRIVHFLTHQKVSHPAKSKIKDIQIDWKSSGNPPESLQNIQEPLRPELNREQGIEQGKNTITDPQAESVPRRVRQEYPEDFERTWETYPKRNGDNPKRSALKAWSARRKAGHTAEVIHAGVERYRRWCEATGKINTETVKQAATFFGPDESFLLPWDIPAAKPVNGYPRTDADWMSKGRQLGIHAKPGESMPAYIGRLKSAMEGAHGNA